MNEKEKSFTLHRDNIQTCEVLKVTFHSFTKSTIDMLKNY